MATSEGGLGAAAPVAAAVAEVAEVGGSKDKDSLEWSEVGTECQKRVYICTNRQAGKRGCSDYHRPSTRSTTSLGASLVSVVEKCTWTGWLQGAN